MDLALSVGHWLTSKMLILLGSTSNYLCGKVAIERVDLPQVPKEVLTFLPLDEDFIELKSQP